MFSVAIAVFALGAVASPLLPRQSGCQPNFEGAAVSVINNQLEWIAPPSAGQGSDIVSAAADPSTPYFHFEFTGQPTNTYLIRCASFQKESDASLSFLSGPSKCLNTPSWSSRLLQMEASSLNNKNYPSLLRKPSVSPT
jgi:hypothetical protein